MGCLFKFYYNIDCLWYSRPMPIRGVKKLRVSSINWIEGGAHTSQMQPRPRRAALLAPARLAGRPCWPRPVRSIHGPVRAGGRHSPYPAGWVASFALSSPMKKLMKNCFSTNVSLSLSLSLLLRGESPGLPLFGGRRPPKQPGPLRAGKRRP